MILLRLLARLAVTSVIVWTKGRLETDIYIMGHTSCGRQVDNSGVQQQENVRILRTAADSNHRRCISLRQLV